MFVFILNFDFFSRQAHPILACLQKLEMRGHIFIRCGTSRIYCTVDTCVERCCKNFSCGGEVLLVLGLGGVWNQT